MNMKYPSRVVIGRSNRVQSNAGDHDDPDTSAISIIYEVWRSSYEKLAELFLPLDPTTLTCPMYHLVSHDSHHESIS